MSRARRIGTEWETAITRFLNTALGMYRDGEAPEFKDPTNPDNVRRQAQEGARDVGDVWARPFVLEAKNEKAITLAEYVRQAEREAENARLPYGAAVVKQRGKGPAAGYVVMSLATFARVLAHIRANTSRN